MKYLEICKYKSICGCKKYCVLFYMRIIVRCRRLKGIGHAALPVASVWYCS